MKKSTDSLMKAKTLISEKINQILSALEQSPSDISNQSQILINLQEKVDKLDMTIANICAEKNMKTIKDHYETITDFSGTFNIPKMWGIKK